jgi:hypothetical protein
MKETPFNLSEEEKLKYRLSLSYEERFKAALKMLRIYNQLKSAKIIKPEDKKIINDDYNLNHKKSHRY